MPIYNSNLNSPDKDYKVAFGQHTTVAASDSVVTGLATVLMVVACLDDNPGDDPFLVSAVKPSSGGTITIKSWKNTSGTDPTPVAATTFSKKVNWIAVGY